MIMLDSIYKGAESSALAKSYQLAPPNKISKNGKRWGQKLWEWFLFFQFHIGNKP
jgi:hypothetical protein